MDQAPVKEAKIVSQSIACGSVRIHDGARGWSDLVLTVKYGASIALSDRQLTRKFVLGTW